MTHFASTGDYGQRYMVEAEGYPSPGWQPILYTNKLEDAERGKEGILLAPSCSNARVIDRGEDWQIWEPTPNDPIQAP
jgi:hypothetical protein